MRAGVRDAGGKNARRGGRRDGDAAARGNGNGNGGDAKSSFATRAIDLGDGFDCGDVLREMCDDAASVVGGEAVVDVVGERADVAAVRRLLRASATRKRWMRSGNDCSPSRDG